LQLPPAFSFRTLAGPPTYEGFYIIITIEKAVLLQVKYPTSHREPWYLWNIGPRE